MHHSLKLSICLNVILLGFLLTGYIGPSVKSTFMPADSLPLITDRYPYRTLIEGIVRVNIQLAKAFQPHAIGR